MKPRLLILASGTPNGGGSGFENLVKNVTAADVVGVVSNNENGGVRERAGRLGVPFTYFSGPYTAENYQKIVREASADFVALSGWLKLVAGLDPKTTFNIHPGPLPEFGGKGLWGRFVHEAVLKAYTEGRIKESAVSMHFVTPEFDEGPVFFSHPVPILPEDTADTLAERVQAAEKEWQPKITDKVVRGEITWDGIHKDTLHV